ncbi:MAG: hypothetical protein GY711_30390 [bacterium]|nr:hypothetical protein [bacterium]
MSHPSAIYRVLLLLLATEASAATPQINLVESFANNAREDVARSGARWGRGRLRVAIGGGSGRLGDLHVASGTLVVLNTDSQDFPLPGRTPDVIGNPDPTGAFPTSITVAGGVFEFASIRVEGVLRLEGTNAVRLYSRGPILIAAGGLVDLSGTTPEAHNSRLAMPEATIPRPPSPAGGGDGGFGGDRFDHSMNPQMLALTNTDPNSDAIQNPGADTKGRDGQGVGRAPSMGEGLGGLQYPADMPFAPFTDCGNFPHGTLCNVVFDALHMGLRCRSMQMGGVGSGGAYATGGGPGRASSRIPVAQWAGCLAPNSDNDPPATTGGDSGPIGLAPPDPVGAGYVRRLLRWELGHLAGGAGGGGGGNHVYWTRTSGYDTPSNYDCLGQLSIFREWHDHSGAAGGAGGGAAQLTSGKDVVVDGVIDASGGNGGSSSYTNDPLDFGRYAMPGGGGSGGAVKLQGVRVLLASAAGRIDVRGGAGGTTVFSGSLGGDGGTGLVRIEDFAPGPGAISAATLAPSILPFEPSDDSLGWLSAGPAAFTPSSLRPDSMMASSSCWIRANGSYNELVFAGDTGQTPDRQGWNMTLVWRPNPQLPAVQRPLRGRTPAFAISFEEEFGKLLGHDLAPGESAAPIAVRFQGARTGGPIDVTCGLELDDPVFVPGSVTPWVDHPELLNGHTPPIDAFRYVVVFDGTQQPAQNDTPGDVLYGPFRGVADLRVTATVQ